MDDQLKDSMTDQQHPTDPLRRVFIPVEKRTTQGTLVFRTLDKQMYARLDNGSIRRATPKVNGKEARKARARARREVHHVQKG